MIHTSEIITTTEALGSLKGRAETIGYVALDTEFVSDRTYYPKLGLIQMGFSRDECYLIDVLAISDLTLLGGLIENPRIVKILHDAQQDLIILRRATGAFPQNVFDTQHAAGFAGMRSTISLRELISTACGGITLTKTETRTNWLQRPLSDPQIDYALDDVRYLPEIREKLLLRAREAKRETWLQEDLDEYNDPDLYKEKEPYDQFRQIKGASRLVDVELSALRELAAWREKEARRRDRPRSWIITNETLMQLARVQPRSIHALKLISGLLARHIGRYGESIVQAIDKSTAAEQSECPRTGKRNGRADSCKTLIDFGLTVVKGKSLGYGIDPGLMATRTEVKALVYQGSSATSAEHRMLRGWRKKVFGEELKALLSG